MTTASLIKECLLSGMTYAETRKQTGAHTTHISQVARRLVAKGYTIRKKSPEAELKALKSIMPKGCIVQILDSLEKEELEKLSTMSFESWADAIINLIKKGEE